MLCCPRCLFAVIYLILEHHSPLPRVINVSTLSASQVTLSLHNLVAIFVLLYIHFDVISVTVVPAASFKGELTSLCFHNIIAESILLGSYRPTTSQVCIFPSDLGVHVLGSNCSCVVVLVCSGL